MAVPKQRAVIVGGGLSGSFTALGLAKAGYQITLLHTNSNSQSAASLVPLALYNPAAALRAKKGWRAQLCAEYLDIAVAELSTFSGDGSFFSANGVLRPALDSKMLEHFRQSFELEEWPDGWIEWFTPAMLNEKYPKLESRFGALGVMAGKTFHTPSLLSRMHEMLAKKYNCTILEEKVTDISKVENNWEVVTHPKTHSTDTLVLAAGVGCFDLLDISPFKLHQVKGQAIEINRPVETANYPSVSAQGYIALMPDRAMVGSTYEHHFDDLDTTDKGQNILLNKVTRAFPDINSKSIEVKNSWAGIRISTPDRKPLLGSVPGSEGLYLSLGFGSKGMTYAPYCGHLLAGHIARGEELPFEVNAIRQLPPSD